MQVEHPVRKALQEAARQDAHEARADHELDVALREPVGHRAVASLALAAVLGEREDRARDARRAGALQRERLAVARAHAGDRRRPPVHALDQRLQVRARARDQHAEPHGARRHPRTRRPRPARSRHRQASQPAAAQACERRRASAAGTTAT